MLLETNNLNLSSPKQVDASKIFGVSKKIMVPYFSQKSDLVPEVDESYVFDDATATSILMGFKYNKKVLIQGLHGTGKSSHIEQISARLNWPCVRINLDGHISRFDLLGKDGIVLEGDKQVTTFKEGLLPWAIKNPVALVFDEYDAGRPDVMFVIQRVLEAEGKLTLLDQNTIITPNATSEFLGHVTPSGLEIPLAYIMEHRI